MIKECKILLSNSACAVIDFDGIEVQIPPIKDAHDFVKIKYENGLYQVVEDDAIVEEKPKKSKKKIKEEPKVEEEPIFSAEVIE